jgi:hypothetical protein
VNPDALVVLGLPEGLTHLLAVSVDSHPKAFTFAVGRTGPTPRFVIPHREARPAALVVIRSLP